jgi:hypothetical protein
MSTSSQLANQAYTNVDTFAQQFANINVGTLNAGVVSPLVTNGLFKYVDYVGYTPAEFATASATGSAILQIVPATASATANYLNLPADSYIETVAVRATTTLAGVTAIGVQVNGGSTVLATVPISAVNSRTYVVNTNLSGVTGGAGRVGNATATVSIVPSNAVTAGACTVYLRVLVPI